MAEENGWGWFWWRDIIEEEEMEQSKCPRCGSHQTRFDEVRGIRVCLSCDYEWE